MDRGEGIGDSRKEEAPLEPQPNGNTVVSNCLRLLPGRFGRGQIRLHRGDARRKKTVVEPTEEVVGRSPLQWLWGRSRSRDEKSSSRLRVQR